MTLNVGADTGGRPLEIDSVAMSVRAEGTRSPLPASRYFGAAEAKDERDSRRDASRKAQIDVAEEVREQPATVLKQARSDGLGDLETDSS